LNTYHFTTERDVDDELDPQPDADAAMTPTSARPAKNFTTVTAESLLLLTGARQALHLSAEHGPALFPYPASSAANGAMDGRAP
jgi:hypothetical protein